MNRFGRFDPLAVGRSAGVDQQAEEPIRWVLLINDHNVREPWRSTDRAYSFTEGSILPPVAPTKCRNKSLVRAPLTFGALSAMNMQLGHRRPARQLGSQLQRPGR